MTQDFVHTTLEAVLSLGDDTCCWRTWREDGQYFLRYEESGRSSKPGDLLRFPADMRGRLVNAFVEASKTASVVAFDDPDDPAVSWQVNCISGILHVKYRESGVPSVAGDTACFPAIMIDSLDKIWQHFEQFSIFQ